MIPWRSTSDSAPIVEAVKNKVSVLVARIAALQVQFMFVNEEFVVFAGLDYDFAPAGIALATPNRQSKMTVPKAVA